MRNTRGVDKRKKHNKNPAVRIQADGSSVGVDRMEILKAFIAVVHKSEDAVPELILQIITILYNELVDFIHDHVQVAYRLFVRAKMLDQSVADFGQDAVKLVFLGLGQILIAVGEIIDCLETASEITQVFQGFFSSAKGHANGEDQRKDDRNAEHGKVDVEEDFELHCEPGSQSGYGQRNKGSEVDCREV